MIQKDIDLVRQELNKAIEQGDKDVIYNLSTKLDILIVQYYREYYSECCA